MRRGIIVLKSPREIGRIQIACSRVVSRQQLSKYSPLRNDDTDASSTIPLTPLSLSLSLFLSLSRATITRDAHVVL